MDTDRSQNNQDKKLCLIVDDNPSNVQVIGELLRAEGYDIAVALNGSKAISIAQNANPDIILLDIMMPDMDGYETCKRLKEDMRTRDIPVIFITAKVSAEDIVSGFDHGAVDYITKPFNFSELLARVETHVKLKRLREKVELDKVRLEKLGRDKNEFLGIAAHDLKNPIFSISMIAKVLLEDESLSHEDIKIFATDILKSTDKVLDLISTFLDINALEEGKMKMFVESMPIHLILEQSIDNYKSAAEAKDIEIIYEKISEDTNALADERAISQIFDNLISNAIKYSPLGKKVFIRIMNRNHMLRVEVQDQGQGIKEAEMPLLFGKFVKLSARPTAGEHSTGLGLSIAKQFAKEMDGNIYCESTPGDGATFIVELPKGSSDTE